jgi:glucosylceramidase
MPKVYRTDETQKFSPARTQDFSPNRYYGLPTLLLDDSVRHQKILGFGASFTDGSCYTLNRLEPGARKALIRDLFGREGLGLNIGRLNVGASDFATECYCYDETADDFEMKDFTVEKDREYLIPVVRQAKDVNPDLFLFSSMWSCPGWMKTSGSMCGGWLRGDYLNAFADYYTRYLLAYQAEGIGINAMTCQNEPETDQISKMPACLLHPDYEKRLVGSLMPERLEKNNLKTRLWILDHNFVHWQRADYLLQDEDVRAHAAGVAFHPYEGQADDMLLLRKRHPEISFHLTEVGPDIGDGYETDWCRWADRIGEAFQYGCESFTAWNLALDETSCPNIGPFPCGGIVTVHSRTCDIKKSGMYWALKQYTSHIRRGAYRVELSQLTEMPAGARATAYKNPDGSVALVFVNRGSRNDIQLGRKGSWLRFSLAADSVSTMIL